MATATDPKLTLRVPKPVLDGLKDEYARTYPDHRLSFNSWLVARLS